MGRLRRSKVLGSLAVLVLVGTGYLLAGRGLGISEKKLSYRLAGYWNGAGDQNFYGPHGIAVDPRNGNVVVTDTLNHRILVLDPSGNFIRQFGREGTGPGEFSHAKGVAVGPEGTIYVSDYFQDRIQKFSEEGRFLLEWGAYGPEAENFDGPAGLAVDGNGNVYVADFYNKVIKVFTSGGHFIGAIGEPGQWGLGRLDYPTDVDVSEDGTVFVADAYNYRIQAFAPGGRPQAAWGWHVLRWLPRPSGEKRGFAVATGIAVDAEQGWIHVADSRNHRIVMLDSKGAFVTDWLLEDVGADIDTPVMLAVSRDGEKVYASDIVKHRVIVLKRE